MARTAALGILLTTLWVPAAAQNRTGFAAFYRPGLMGRVADRRGIPWSAGDCLVASPYHRIGAVIRVRRPKTGIRRTCTVVDVPHPRDRDRIIRRGIVVELDYYTNRAMCPANEPPRACVVTVGG